MKRPKKEAPGKKSGVGAHGARGTPAGGAGETPKWRGGPPKGENERPPRKKNG